MAIQRTVSTREQVNKELELSSLTQPLGYFLSTEL